MYRYQKIVLIYLGGLIQVSMTESSKQLITYLGYNIRAERVRRGLSQDELSEKVGLHRTYIGNVERGEKNITVLNCSKIAEALNIKLSDLLQRVEESVKTIRRTEG